MSYSIPPADPEHEPEDQEGGVADGLAEAHGESLLRRWEHMLDDDGDPVAALAKVLGDQAGTRRALFDRVGDVVLGCRLESILGAGGMGVTYAATDAAGEPVAVKLVSAIGRGDGRFVRECRSLIAVHHPAVVRYRDHAVMGDGTGVLVMDRVFGADLSALLASVALPNVPSSGSDPVALWLSGLPLDLEQRLRSPRYVRRVLQLLADVADGLHAAHQQDIVHRDVKPANIVVQSNLRPVLIDFGLARDQQQLSSFTASGAAIGTLAYMAPEQLSHGADAVGPACDIYGVGMVLLEAMSGEMLLENVRQVMRDRVQPFVLTRRLQRCLPVPLQAVLYRSLAVRPSSRYGSAAELAEDLRKVAAHAMPSATRPHWFVREIRRPGARLCILAGVVLMVTLLAFGLWQRGRYVRFRANCESLAARVMLDNGYSTFLGERTWLPCGDYSVRLQGSDVLDVTRSFEVVESEGVQVVYLSTQMLSEAADWLQRPGHVSLQFSTGCSWIQLRPSVERDDRWLDGQRIESKAPHFPAGLLQPGRHHFRAVDGRGRVEEQWLDIGTEPVDVQLLPRVLADVDGSFRCTWSTVLSPRPAALQVGGDAVLWAGIAQRGVIAGAGTWERDCCYAPSLPLREATIELRCDFPTPMCSAVVFLRGSASMAGSRLEIEAGFEGQAMRPWPMVENEAGIAPVPLQQFAAADGARALLVRARVAADGPLTDEFTLVRFLSGRQFGGHWIDEPPCIAIVADPGSIARLPVEPDVLSVADAPELILCDSQLSFPREPVLSLALLKTEPSRGDGMDELALGLGGDGSSNRVVRVAWPTGKVLQSLYPGRTSDVATGDSDDFGAALVSLEDVDGDGRAELVVGDPSSAKRGALYAGDFRLFGSRSGNVFWRWPTWSVTTIPGDESAGRHPLVVDWDGDGVNELVLSAPNRESPEGIQKVGFVEIVSARDLAPLWSAFGKTQYQRVRALDACATHEGVPYVLISRDTAAIGDVRLGNSFRVLTPPDTVVVETPDLSHVSHAIFLREARRGARSSGLRLAFALKGERPGEVVLSALDLMADGAPEVLQRCFVVGVEAIDSLRDWQLRRIGDVDGDGLDDFVVFYGAPGQGSVLVVSAADFELLGYRSLEASIQDVLWLPAAIAREPRLLLALNLAGDGVVQSLRLR